tara:strand:- start:770 stop:877 length:108 start_codon:yes stop_codon:yes gene_type:complete
MRYIAGAKGKYKLRDQVTWADNGLGIEKQIKDILK